MIQDFRHPRQAGAPFTIGNATSRRTKGRVAASFGGMLLVLGAASGANAQVLQQYLPDVVTDISGQAPPPLAPDTTADLRGLPETKPGTTVTTRPHPEYDTSGVHVGDFYIRPQLAESIGYNSNLFADRSGRGAFFVETKPAVSAASNWSRNGVSAAIALDNVVYPSESSQNFTNLVATVNGYYDIGRDRLQASYTHGSLHIAHGTIDSGNFNAPIPFDFDAVHLAYLAPFSRISIEPALDFQSFRFQNGAFTSDGVTVPVNEKINNRNVIQGTVTTRYNLSPLRDLVLVVRGAGQNFTDIPAGTPTLDSQSFEILTGIDFNVDAVLRVRALVGYEQRNFSSSAYQTRTAPILNGDVIWTPTQLTTITGRVIRSIEDSVSVSTNGFTYTSAKLLVDHEYRRNILLNAHIQFQNADYSSSQGSEQLYGGGISATWRLNRRVSVIGSYDYAYRQASPTLGQSYSQNLILLSLGLRL